MKGIYVFLLWLIVEITTLVMVIMHGGFIFTICLVLLIKIAGSALSRSLLKKRIASLDESIDNAYKADNSIDKIALLQERLGLLKNEALPPLCVLLSCNFLRPPFLIINTLGLLLLVPYVNILITKLILVLIPLFQAQMIQMMMLLSSGITSKHLASEHNNSFGTYQSTNSFSSRFIFGNLNQYDKSSFSANNTASDNIYGSPKSSDTPIKTSKVIKDAVYEEIDDKESKN